MGWMNRSWGWGRGSRSQPECLGPNWQTGYYQRRRPSENARKRRLEWIGIIFFFFFFLKYIASLLWFRYLARPWELVGGSALTTSLAFNFLASSVAYCANIGCDLRYSLIQLITYQLSSSSHHHYRHHHHPHHPHRPLYPRHSQLSLFIPIFTHTHTTLPSGAISASTQN